MPTKELITYNYTWLKQISFPIEMIIVHRIRCTFDKHSLES